MYPVPVILLSVVDTGIWSLEQLRSWADELIGQLRRPALWLLELSTSRTVQEAELAIRGGVKRAQVMLPEDHGDLLVGLLALQFERGELQEQDFAASVGDVLDAYEGSRLNVELWYRLTSNGRTVTTASKEITDDLARIAAEAEQRLSQIETVAVDPFFSVP